MVGTTLAEIRTHLEALASDGGEYYVACGRTGHRPVPVAGKRFADRATARDAARATEQYRAALRRYDPQVPRYDLIVRQDGTAASPTEQPADDQPGEVGRRTTTMRDDDPRAGGRSGRVEFCHDVAAAVFETLSDDGHDAAETAVVDAYLELAETVESPDELCLCLLESMARELATHLEASVQADVLAGAAARLGPAEPADSPLAATLSHLERRRLLRRHGKPRTSEDHDGVPRSSVAELADYALTPRDGLLPVLPVVVDLCRRRPGRPPSSVRAVETDVGWRVRVVRCRDAEPGGLLNAPIHTEP